jgi:hypothetical protein
MGTDIASGVCLQRFSMNFRESASLNTRQMDEGCKSGMVRLKHKTLETCSPILRVQRVGCASMASHEHPVDARKSRAHAVFAHGDAR